MTLLFITLCKYDDSRFPQYGKAVYKTQQRVARKNVIAGHFFLGDNTFETFSCAQNLSPLTQSHTPRCSCSYALHTCIRYNLTFLQLPAFPIFFIGNISQMLPQDVIMFEQQPLFTSLMYLSCNKR